MRGLSLDEVASWFCVSSLWLLPMPAARSSSESRSVANARSKFWVTSPMISPSFLLQSLLVGIRSVLGRLSDGNWCFPLGFQPPKWGARKYYLHLHLPESGRCRLQVILLNFKIREKSKNTRLRGPPGATKQALKLYRERFGGGSWRGSAGRFPPPIEIPPLGPCIPP